VTYQNDCLRLGAGATFAREGACVTVADTTGGGRIGQ
jgi:hypothetical protein